MSARSDDPAAIEIKTLSKTFGKRRALQDVSIRVEPEGGCAWTHIRDEGQGIAAEELPRVFERFYRTKGALSGGARGSGLGLAIVKHIVQQLGGDVRVSSQLGRGSEFSFSMRVAGHNSEF